MRISDNKTGFTRVDHITFDLVIPTLSLAAQAVFLRVYRQTVGWNKPADAISNSQFRSTTGIYKGETVRRAIAELEGKKLLSVVRTGTKTNEYSINWEELYAYVDNLWITHQLPP